jgi:drug/metabolite transporter (DMT)-like permease
LAIFPTFSAFFVQLWAQKRVAPVKTGLIFSFEPVFAAVFAWTLGGEIMKVKSLIGGTIIMTAIIMSEISNFNRVRKKEKEKRVIIAEEA